jgi:hypothetical protein
VISKYIKTSGIGNKFASLASMSGGLTWEEPSFSDYQVLSRYPSSVVVVVVFFGRKYSPSVIFVMENFYIGSSRVLENIQKCVQMQVCYDCK